MLNEPEFLTADEAAGFLFATENSLRSMRSIGSGPPFHKQGGRVRYLRSDLETYIAGFRACDRTQLELRRKRAEKLRGASTA